MMLLFLKASGLATLLRITISVVKQFPKGFNIKLRISPKKIGVQTQLSVKRPNDDKTQFRESH